MTVSVGDDIPEWRMDSVQPELMRTMAAILRDPNPVHWDKAVVEEMGHGARTVNQGPLGLSYMVNMLHEWMGPTCIRRIVMRFPQFVMSGDKVIAKGKITAIRSEDGERLADCDIWLEREGSEPPLEGFATVSVTD